MKPNEIVVVTTKDRVHEIAKLELEGQKMLQLGLPSLVDDHLQRINRALKAFLADYESTKKKKVGTKELAKVSGFKVPAGTRACREKRVAGAALGANGRWEMTADAAEAFAKRRRPDAE
jgi:hypothetical protein